MKKLSKILIGAAAGAAVFTPATFALTSCENKGLPVVTYLDNHGRMIMLNTNDTSKIASEKFWFTGSLDSIKVELWAEVDPEYTGDVWFDLLKPKQDGKNVYFYFKTKDGWDGQYPMGKVILHIKTTNKNNQKSYDSKQKFTVHQKTN